MRRTLPLLLALMLAAIPASAGGRRPESMASIYAQIPSVKHADELLDLIDRASELRGEQDEFTADQSRPILTAKLESMAVTAESDGRVATATYLWYLLARIDHSRAVKLENADPGDVALSEPQTSYERCRRDAALLATRAWPLIEPDSGTIEIAEVLEAQMELGRGLGPHELHLVWPVGPTRIQGQDVFHLASVTVSQVPIKWVAETQNRHETVTSTIAAASEADVERWKEREAQIQALIDREAASHAVTVDYVGRQKGKTETFQTPQLMPDREQEGLAISVVTQETYASAHADELIEKENTRWDLKSSHLAEVQFQHRSPKPDPSATREVERTESHLVDVSGWTGDLNGAIRCTGQHAREIVLSATSVVRPETTGGDRSETEAMIELEASLNDLLLGQVTHRLENEVELKIQSMQWDAERTKGTSKERELESRLIVEIIGEDGIRKTPEEIEKLTTE